MQAGGDGPPAGRRPFLALMLLAAAGKKKSEEKFAVVAGTVFRETGFTLRGAEVRLDAEPPAKIKPMKTLSDPRGEFAFRVPAAPMRYNVSVKAAGFRPQAKKASVSGDERVDVFFQLEAETKDVK